jgi:hypothetical protein
MLMARFRPVMRENIGPVTIQSQRNGRGWKEEDDARSPAAVEEEVNRVPDRSA